MRNRATVTAPLNCKSVIVYDRTNFKEFFDNLPRGVKGSTLASYDKSDVEKRFKTDDGRAFAPELYARLQKLKGQGAFLPPSFPPSPSSLPPSSFLLPLYCAIFCFSLLTVVQQEGLLRCT